ncbi:GntR family transcriptional regulator [Roseomonas sp. CCTCC AB2023176]|uniref:GntR family transcriptional regulator n=1 Tax=Roseomonas sp. CCTCC AB2023176 TaxID=3342640 RepID=UPI0035D93398
MQAPPSERSALDGLPRAAPFWLRIAEVLRAELRDGIYPPGRPLPGEHELAARFGAARMTLRRAMDALAAEGLLRREAGRGTFAAAAAAAAGNTAGWAADVRGFSAASEVAILALGPAPLPAAPAVALGLEAGLGAMRLERVRRDEAGPFSHALSWVPLPLGARLPRRRLETGVPLPEILADRGARMASAEQAIGAEAASPALSAALGVAIGAPLVRLDRTMTDAEGVPFVHTRFLYRADRFAYRVPLDAEGRARPPRWAPVVRA